MASRLPPTFNPTRFETPYGIGLLDDLHNILPEVLYDTTVFQTSPLVRLVQARTHELFDADYVRQKTQYRLFQEDWRRRRMTSRGTVFRFGGGVAPAPPMPPVGVQEPQGGQGSQEIPRTLYTIPLVRPDLTSAILMALGTEALAAELDTENLSPVPVTPSQEVLQANSILTSIEPGPDVMCAICQSHDAEGESQWRILRACQHEFHRRCIDRWFSQNVHCPVCRHDIRDMGEEEGI